MPSPSIQEASGKRRMLHQHRKYSKKSDINHIISLKKKGTCVNLCHASLFNKKVLPLPADQQLNKYPI